MKSKKLSLGKVTITNLCNESLGNIRAGVGGFMTLCGDTCKTDCFVSCAYTACGNTCEANPEAY